MVSDTRCRVRYQKPQICVLGHQKTMKNFLDI